MRFPAVIAGAWAIAALQVAASSYAANPATPETHPGITVSHETLTLRDGVQLQVIITKPANATGRLPAIQFVQWLSCDTVGISTNPRDG
jgi:predicted acyl esterase